MKTSIHKTLLSASLVLSAAAWVPSAQAQLEPLACGRGFCAFFACTTDGVEGTCCGNSDANTITCTETDNGCLIEGFGGADMLTGSAAEGDIICGGSGDDILSGLGGNDALLGQADDDNLNGGDGDRDVCAGGPGTDTADPSCEARISVP
jgi:hypothetical protein